MSEDTAIAPRNVGRKERGAALILTVIVIMVLSIVGMAMVQFTTAEERTATSYRDALQARALADAGANIVIEMFRDPTNRQLVPKYSSTASSCSDGTADYCGTDEASTETSLNAKGMWRAERPALTPGRYTGINNKFFLGPFRDAWGQTFGGTYSSTSDVYDLKFNCTNPSTGAVVSSSNCWLDSKINALLASSSDYNLSSGKITDISFYRAPTAGPNQYGITTVRITAVKTGSNGAVLARETMEVVVGDSTPTPAVLGNGNVKFVTGGGDICGDGCQQIWSNGDYEGCNSSGCDVGGGDNPVINAYGSVSPDNASNDGGKSKIKAPEINPWDLAYKPTTATELGKYWLVAARQLDTVWTNGTKTDNPAPRPCGLDELALCQDYNLEYDTSGNPKAARSSTGTAYMYKWDSAGEGWTECDTAVNGVDDTLQCTGSPRFTVTRANDLAVAGSADTAHIPFNVNRVPRYSFNIDAAVDGSTVLIDGIFTKSGSMSATMSLIVVGSMSFHASSTWFPAMSNFVMWVSGRDIYTHSNCCAPSNTCSTNLTNNSMAIWAAHEQMMMDSQNAMAGIIVAENRVNLDTLFIAPSAYAINHDKGDHAYSCDGPKWPWTMPTIPYILSKKSVPD